MDMTGPTTATPSTTTGSDTSGLTIDSVMHGIMEQESRGNYQAQSATETASGAYQYIDSTWGDYQGYAHAKDAPPAVQDQKMREDLEREYQRLGDWERVIAAHFVGEDGQGRIEELVGPGSGSGEEPQPVDQVLRGFGVGAYPGLRCLRGGSPRV